MLLFICSIAVTSLTYAYPPLTNDWPNFHGNLENTGVAYPTLYGIPTPQLLWSYTTDNLISPSSPSLADIDNDGKLEVLVGTANFASTGGIYALGSDGSLKWKYLPGDYGTYDNPAVEDIDGDGYKEIAFVSYNGKITVLNYDGTVNWVVDKGSGGTKTVIADVDGDGKMEVLAGAAGQLFCLDGASGAQKWSANYRLGGVPAIADFDGDSKPEIVLEAGGTNTLVALNGEDGSLLWTSPTIGQDFQSSVTAISDVDVDGNPDVVAGSREIPGHVYAFSGATGAQLWSYTTVKRCQSCAAVADLDNDGDEDVVVASDEADDPPHAYVYSIDAKTGTLNWQHDIVGKEAYTAARTPAIVDVDKDGILDVIICSHDGNVYALKGTDGSEIWTYNYGSDTGSAPAIADIDGNTVMDIVFAARDTVFVLTGPPPPPPPVGGVWVPINKFDLMAPWIGLASLMTVVAASVVYVKHRKKKRT